MKPQETGKPVEPTFLTGCTHLRPKTIAVYHFDYSTAIADSWKQQTLLNIVKLRDMELPIPGANGK